MCDDRLYFYVFTVYLLCFQISTKFLKYLGLGLFAFFKFMTILVFYVTKCEGVKEFSIWIQQQQKQMKWNYFFHIQIITSVLTLFAKTFLEGEVDH